MKLKRKLWITVISISIIIFCIVMTLFISTTNMDYGSNFSNSIDYSEMWTNKEIMVIVPHQDDEINLAGATIKRLIDNGNNVKVVFATNGDFKGLGTKRIKEAVEAVRILGVNSENVIFLGYGDRWEETKEHIYNSDDNKIISSYIGKNETYGTDKYLDFRSSISGEPSSYTRGNYKNDMKDVIEMYFPDIIFAIDFDSHADHKSTSLIFEEAFCEVLRENKEYNPKVFKGFAYKTAWKAKDDFYGFNLESTLIPEKDSLINKNYDLDVPQYLWSERVRLPVAKEALSYTQNSNLVNKSLKAHKTQKASRRTVNIVNSDKVFWERETSSITYEAEVIASSGEFKYINDFKLIDSSNVNDIKLIDECVWIPDNEDNDKSFRINFASAKDIEKLVIYDNFSLEDNILESTIRFSDGSEEKVNNLNHDGTKTVITFPTKKDIEFLEFKINKYEGNNPGICEFEVYEKNESKETKYIKLILDNENETFIYRYTVDNEKEIPLNLYSYPKLDGILGLENCNISTNNDNIQFKENKLIISDNIKPGKYKVRVELKDNTKIFDEIEIFIPNKLQKGYIKLTQEFEKIIKKIPGKIEGEFYKMKKLILRE